MVTWNGFWPALAFLVTGLLAVGCAITTGTSNAEWTTAGRGHVPTALREELRARGLEPARYEAPQDPERKHDYDQLLELHDVVLQQVWQGMMLLLPTKKRRLDWSLGEDVRALREGHEADYALFVVLRDSYASAERHTANIALTIITLGSASLPLGRNRSASSLAVPLGPGALGSPARPVSS